MFVLKDVIVAIFTISAMFAIRKIKQCAWRRFVFRKGLLFDFVSTYEYETYMNALNDIRIDMLRSR